MAPPKSRPQPDDSRSEASSTKEKAGPSSSNANGKNRRTTTAVAGSSLRDMVTAGTDTTAATGTTLTSAEAGSGNANTEPNAGIQWSTLDSSILHGYRHSYHLPVPAAFNNPNNQIVLSRTNIGRMSPTMARRKEMRKQSKDALATTIRRHFNSMGIVENDVIVDFLYKVRWQDKNFRMRFAPQRPR